MNNQSFKVGDRVRVLTSRGAYGHNFRKGDVVEVREVRRDTSTLRGYCEDRKEVDEQFVPLDEIEPAYDQFDAMHAASPEIIAAVLERDFPTPSPNQPYNDAQNAAKRAVSRVLGIPQKHVHAGMEAYMVAYRAARIIQKGGAK